MRTMIAGNARPVVDFAEPLTSKTCIDMFDRIRSLRDDLFFAEVQPRLSSPRGEVVALEYIVEAARELRRNGFRIDTHAVTKVASAAAVMLSLGDVRTAHPKAALVSLVFVQGDRGGRPTIWNGIRKKMDTPLLHYLRMGQDSREKTNDI